MILKHAVNARLQKWLLVDVAQLTRLLILVSLRGETKGYGNIAGADQYQQL